MTSSPPSATLVRSCARPLRRAAMEVHHMGVVMTCTIEAEHQVDREARADTCPNCNGVLTTNQDGWKVCYACGYSSPGYAPAPAGPTTGTVAGLN